MENNKKTNTNMNLDMKDTAGWILMEHEERLKKILNRERRNENGRENASIDTEHKN